ncbi:ornithine carbamoyltransferase [Clostridium baratii]|uniref:ornithine carbamoyltransferase n=1 Tax=Clostridium baratii TaxID=1561 RepID=UPI0006C49811|nr:ornithine carbamoyltransferase [Clostridium baratii]MDU4911513.1 ornithine carbamoyltransferase [Clostridium baratii]CUP58094.1 ornithine carbamoyltransferase [Clostridium baratii]
MKKDLLTMKSLTKNDILELLNLADQLKYEKNHGIPHPFLKGKTLGMIFEKSSTRTRVSFEVGMNDLGGHPLFLSSSDLQIGRGEPICDTARVLSRYLDCIMIRTYSQEEVESLSKYSTIPIINGLTDLEHPCQVLADLMTIREYKNSFDNLKVCYIGDGNNMAHSLMIGCLKVGMDFAIACPKEYLPLDEYIKYSEELSKENGTKFKLTTSPKEAAIDADIVITDVWASMGQEEEAKKRQEAFKGYTVDLDLIDIAKDDAIVLHCLPAHRGEEISSEVLDRYSPSIFDEAENRLHVQKAVLVKLMS